MSKKPEYNNDSIVLLKGSARVREKPAVIFGSDGLEGCEHSFFEILSNSIDEAREGFGDVIEVTRRADGSLSIKDYGRGIPLDFNKKEDRYNWELVYCELYAGGKMNSANYDFSLGLNGLGACATQYASEFFDVEVCRDGYIYKLHFEHGENIGGLTKKKDKSGQHSYSYQHWKPDRDVFTETDIPLDYLKTVLNQQAIVNDGVKFVFTDEQTGESCEYHCPDGILGHVRTACEDGALSTPAFYEREGLGRDRSDKDDYKVRAKISFCFSNTSNALEYFHNSSFLENGGAPDKAVRAAVVQAFDKAIANMNKYIKGESKITFADIQDSFFYVSSTFSSATMTSYANQTKKAITNKFIQDFLTSSLTEIFTTWILENKSESDKVIEQILVNKRSRESSEKQRLNIKKKLTGSIDINNQVKKFVDCRSRDVNLREIYIVEGDSALGSCKTGRDAEFQAIIPVRGKILNCLKADYKRIFDSDIIVDIIRVLGCGVELNKKFKDIPPFNINKLRWNKIIICTDADVDGFQIRTLILAMLYRLAPSLIANGKVFIAETPLFEITYKTRGKTETFFAFDEKEKNKYLKGKNLSNITIMRSKGLGENDPDMMWETTMNPETRRLIRVTTEEAAIMSETFELLLGDNLAGRKDYIKENGHLYLDDLDLS